MSHFPNFSAKSDWPKTCRSGRYGECTRRFSVAGKIFKVTKRILFCFQRFVPQLLWFYGFCFGLVFFFLAFGKGVMEESYFLHGDHIESRSVVGSTKPKGILPTN